MADSKWWLTVQNNNIIVAITMSYDIMSLAHFEDLKGTILDVLHTTYDPSVIIKALILLKFRGGGGRSSNPPSPWLNRFKTGCFNFDFLCYCLMD